MQLQGVTFLSLTHSPYMGNIKWTVYVAVHCSVQKGSSEMGPGISVLVNKYFGFKVDPNWWGKPKYFDRVFHSLK